MGGGQVDLAEEEKPLGALESVATGRVVGVWVILGFFVVWVFFLLDLASEWQHSAPFVIWGMRQRLGIPACWSLLLSQKMKAAKLCVHG